MSSQANRNVASIALFWIFLAVAVAALAAGWGASHAPVDIDGETRNSLTLLHVSLGLTAALALALQILLGVALYALGGAARPSGARERAAFWLRIALYGAGLAMVVSGALAASCGGEEVLFWGYALPDWGGIDAALCDLPRKVHDGVAYALTAAAAACLGFALFDRLNPEKQAENRALEMSAPTTVAAIIAEGLAHSFRIFGAGVFWLQLLLAVVSGVLLAFGYVGHTVSPDGSGFGDAIYWASAALGLLGVTILFASQYERTAKGICDRPDRYLRHDRRGGFWFVGVSALFSITGAMISFVGVGLSVALLIGKTVSQPPGIAITDPNKIIRALDIFVLLVNFDLLFAHFVGLGVAVWLIISVLKARHDFVVTEKPGE
jgi:cytochrome b561